MNGDIRLSTAFFSHPKTIKLQRRLGDAGIVALLKLWTFTAQYRPQGILNNVSDEDLIIATGYEDVTNLIQTLLDLRFVEKENDWLKIHDWEVHNRYCFFSDIRSEIARKNVSKRWEEKHGKIKKKYKRYTDGIRTVYKADTPSPIPFPIPSQYQNPKPLADKIPPKPSKEKMRVIGDLCEQIDDSLDGFNPYAFVQKTIKAGIPPDVTQEVLKEVAEKKTSIKDPWAFVTYILQSKYQRFNYAQEFERHTRLKNEPVDLAAIFGNLKVTEGRS